MTAEYEQFKPDGPARDDVHKMFDRISNRYDLLNRLLSMRRDVAWRKKVVSMLPDRENPEILDLATGTGDLLLAFCKYRSDIKSGLGIDLSQGMLEIARKKTADNPKLSLLRGDAVDLPLDADSYDAVSIAFGIRNVLDVPKALSEMYRVLKPGGKALILEFSLPRNKIIKALYLFYFRKILPAVGSVISGDSYAYRYLNQTVESFPYGEAFCKLMNDTGFKEVRDNRLSMGIASIYEGTK